MELTANQISTAIASGCRVRLGVIDLLEWAFQEERVQLDFDDLGLSDLVPAGVGMEWKLSVMGCGHLDGGGRSLPHPDAEIVASFLADLPDECGGRSMAIEIANMAKSGRSPEWGEGRVARCEPKEWKRSRHGKFAAREMWQEKGRWPEPWLGRNDGYACRVYFYDTDLEVRKMRAGYQVWWRALEYLAVELELRGRLSSFVVTGALPPRRPWEKNS